MHPIDVNFISKFLIFFGVLCLLAGSTLYFLDKAGIGIGKLPGDILVQKGNFTFYFPIVTSIIISIALTLFLGLFQKK